VIIGLLKAIETTWQALAKKLTKLLDKYGLRKRLVAYVKDEGSNLKTMIVALKSTISCEYFGLEESFQDTCFGHAFEKT